jgi:hypothetical protein
VCEEVSAITRVVDLGPIEVSNCGVNFVFVQIYFYAVELKLDECKS